MILPIHSGSSARFRKQMLWTKILSNDWSIRLLRRSFSSTSI